MYLQYIHRDFSVLDKHDTKKRAMSIINQFEGMDVPNIYLIHGDMDPMVPYQETIEAEKKLSQLSIDVKAHISKNTQHSIAQDGLDIAIKFLVEKFSN